MKYVFVFVLTVLFSCNITNDKGKRTRSFKLTKDSTFIGAWGGELKDGHSGYFPSFTKSYNLVFIYSKDNKIYVNNRPRYFDTTNANEQDALKSYLSNFNNPEGINYFSERYKVENDTQLSEEMGVGTINRYIIDNDNNLNYSTVYFIGTPVFDTSYEYYYKFKPYFFKTIKNPEDKLK